jgi:hypothetical protein
MQLAIYAIIAACVLGLAAMVVLVSFVAGWIGT